MPLYKEPDFTMLFESAPVAFLVLKADLTIVAASNQYLQMTMTTRENIIGKKLFEIIDDDSDKIDTSIKRVMSHHIADSFVVQKYPIRQLDNEKVLQEQDWNIINAPILDEKNNLQYVMHRVEKVTELVQALQQANKELEAFSYSVSHDLRAPLRSINGFSQILQDKYEQNLPPEAQRYLKLVRDSANEMGCLVDGLLAFSRLGSQALKTQKITMTPLIKEIADKLVLAQSKPIEMIIAPDLPACQADLNLLTQVLTNLLSNALKFTRHVLSPRIEIGFLNQNQENIYFVKDNGVGFNMRYAGKLFAVFQRLHKTEEYEGTGVGLAIVDRIIRRHNGRVWVEAQVDKGATFFFTLGVHSGRE